MSWLTPQLFAVLTGLVLWLFTAGGWYVEAQKADRYKARAEACEAKHQAFADQVKATGKIAEEAARTKEAEYRRIHDETSRAWAAALDVVRVQYAARPGPRGSGVSVTPVAADRVVVSPTEPLPAPERIIADCAEDTLKLVWLQHWVQEALP